MKKQTLIGKNGHGETLLHEGYLLDGGIFGVYQEKKAPDYSRWKILHLPTSGTMGFGRTRKEVISKVERVLALGIDLNKTEFSQDELGKLRDAVFK